MAAVAVCRELDFIYRHEVNRARNRHCLDRADPVVAIGGGDPLFARHEGDLVRVDEGTNPVEDLPREEPEGQADHASRMRQHALDRHVSLTGIGWTQDRVDLPGQVVG